MYAIDMHPSLNSRGGIQFWVFWRPVRKTTISALPKEAGGLKLDGIDGESMDDKHKDTIHIESFSTRSPKSNFGSGRSTGVQYRSSPCDEDASQAMVAFSKKPIGGPFISMIAFTPRLKWMVASSRGRRRTDEEIRRTGG